MSEKAATPPEGYVEVALPLPMARSWTYGVPAGLHQPPLGTRVLVPFGRKERIGWVIAGSAGPPEGDVRELLAVLDEVPSVPAELLALGRWVADYYLCSLGLVLRAALPGGLADTSTESVALVDPRPHKAELSPLEQRLEDWLLAAGEAQPVARLRRECGPEAWWPVIRALEARGRVRVVSTPPMTAPPVRTQRVMHLSRDLPTLVERDRIFGRARRQRELWEAVQEAGGSVEVAHLAGRLGFSYPVINGLVERGVAAILEEEVVRDPYGGVPAADPPAVRPTAAQAAAIAALVEAARTPDPATFLLRGVTGSGKTLVYLELLREIVDRQGRTAIVLVPEIALTPQTVGRFRGVFGERVAVLHSGLSDGERYDEWRQLRDGTKRVVVGARSAVFAPLPDLGAIVVDEEHEGSYKQSETPRYHAREVAVVRCRAAGALCLLGSATPSLESWRNAQTGKYQLLELPERVAELPLPPVRLVDLRRERSRGGGAAPILAPPLLEAMATRLARGEQCILLLNRRGFSTFVQCRDCGAVRQCGRCNVSLTLHRRPPRLTCHHCLHVEPAPERCSACGSADLNFRGVGTEQVERTVGEAFPAARLARMDVDTTSGKWSHHRILERVERREVDILLGTQMIAKGLDFPNVTLVGVVNADVGMNLPDFRATERTFQLLTQVGGRAGRGPRGGEVIIQTSLPEHYALQAAATHDFVGFAARELQERRTPTYPPHARLVNVLVSATDETAAQEGAQQAADWVGGLLRSKGLSGVDLVGPAPCPIDRLHGRWRWHLLLRADSSRLLGEVARFFRDRFTIAPGAHARRVALDRDPVSLL